MGTNEVAVKVILILVVIAVAAGVAFKFKDIAEPVLEIVNTMLYDDVLDRYGEWQLKDKEAINSMSALLYSVNRLAWLDTYSSSGWVDSSAEKYICTRKQLNQYEKDESRYPYPCPEGYVCNIPALALPNMPIYCDKVVDEDVEGELKEERQLSGLEIGSFESFGRSYGDTKVIPTIVDTMIIYYKTELVTDDIQAREDEISKKIALNMLYCFQQFKDKGRNNVRCSAGDFSGVDKKIEIDSEDIKNGFKLLEEDPLLCDQYCQDMLKDLTGGDWYNFFNGKNWEMDIEGEIITHETAGSKMIRICGDDGTSKTVDKESGAGSWQDFTNGVQDFFFLDRIFVTDDVGRCVSPVDQMLFTLHIEGFNLPQAVDVPGHPSATDLALLSNPYAAPSVLMSDPELALQVPQNLLYSVMPHGDPKYITYYEKFPEGEDSSWAMNEYMTAVFKIDTDFFLAALNGLPVVGPPMSFYLGSTAEGRQVVANTLARIEQAAKNSKGVFDIDFISIIGDSMADLLGFVKSHEGDMFAGINIHSGPVQNYLVVKYAGLSFFDKDYRKFVQDAAEEFSINEKNQKTLLSFGKAKDGFSDVYVKIIEQYFDENKEIIIGNRLSPDIMVEMEEILGELAEDSRFTEALAEKLDEEIFENLGDILFLFRGVSQANDKLLSWQDTASQDIVLTELRDMLEANDAYIDEAEKDHETYKEFEDNLEIALPMMLEEQEKNTELLSNFSSSGKDLDLLDKMAKDISQKLDDAQKKIFSGGRNLVDTDASLEREKLSRQVLIRMIRDASINEKFYFIGTNSIGLRTPYRGTVVYDDKWTRDWDWASQSDTERKDTYLEYFEHFGGYTDEEASDALANKYFSEKYFGLLPEVNRYYLSIQRDKLWRWFDQPNLRFHLVSPCKADIQIRVTNCECYGTSAKGYDDTTITSMFTDLARPSMYETGTKNPDIPELYVANFDGTNKMLYSIDSDGTVIKECPPKKTISLPWTEASYSPTCIEINPIIDDSVFPNYCYRGQKPPLLAGADVFLNWALPTGCGSMPIFGLMGGPLCGVFGKMLYYPMEQYFYSWPLHGGDFAKGET
ncbi:hypothetical protein JXC34_05665 [Candidatus Woesearchaeota archaeon]|nr:hypothetical protein [Candidatus Woesearchaeota archaeon]